MDVVNSVIVVKFIFQASLHNHNNITASQVLVVLILNFVVIQKLSGNLKLYSLQLYRIIYSTAITINFMLLHIDYIA